MGDKNKLTYIVNQLIMLFLLSIMGDKAFLNKIYFSKSSNFEII